MLSFSDMTLSLLCFFLILVSMSPPPPLVTPDEKPDATKTVKQEGGAGGAPKPQSLDDLVQKLQARIKEKKLGNLLHLVHNEKGLHIEFAANLVFTTTSAEPNILYRKEIDKLTEIIAPFTQKYKVSIEGYTDDLPIRSGQAFASNWELSAARGFSILHRLEEFGAKDEKISVSAFAHTHPKVPYKGLTGAELQAARDSNRRVVIWLE